MRQLCRSSQGAYYSRPLLHLPPRTRDLSPCYIGSDLCSSVARQSNVEHLHHCQLRLATPFIPHYIASINMLCKTLLPVVSTPPSFSRSRHVREEHLAASYFGGGLDRVNVLGGGPDGHTGCMLLCMACDVMLLTLPTSQMCQCVVLGSRRRCVDQ